MKKTIFRLTAAMLVTAFAITFIGNGEGMAKNGDSVFEDVPESHWAFDCINKAYEKGFFVETGDNQFEPDRSFTRAEFIQMIAACLELPVPDDPAIVYTDVREEDPYFNAVVAAENAGILDVLKGGQPAFMPEYPITREEAASVLGFIPSHLGIVTTMQYIDLSGIYEDYNQVDQKYRRSLQTVYHLGFMKGTTKITFSPKDFVTRAQAAVILVRLLDTVEQVFG